jgi:hypothetical protein
MRSDQIKTDEDMLHHLLDCTLATVEDLGNRTRPPKGELHRQCLIAQDIVNHLRFSGRQTPHGRAKLLEAHSWQVEDWAASFKK